MIISRTPFRMSFFGGGTDYPVWFREHGGAVLATTIDKYCYISCRRLPPFFEHRSRIAYSRIELVKNHEDIEHPAVRGVLKYLNINDGLEIHHDGDLPARTGLGSSSSFTVGLLHTLYALQHIMPSKDQLAQAAIHVEQNVLGEAVGCQDQVLAAYGSLCKATFFPNGEIGHTPIIMQPDRLAAFQSHLQLYFTGFFADCLGSGARADRSHETTHSRTVCHAADGGGGHRNSHRRWRSGCVWNLAP